MPKNRRQFLRTIGSTVALATLPSSIQKALAIPAVDTTGTIKDVKHVVILMLENRSFDHYFGTLRGVRGFGDPHPIPLPDGRTVWHESDGTREIPPFHLDTANTNALRVPNTPHTYPDSQAAWNQGKFGFWPKFKTQYSMGYYERADIPFQFALAEAFTICDAHHCSISTGTDPNRIVFWSGSNFDPELRARGENCTAANAEVNNLRCEIRGTLPSPGYTYQGTAFKWATIPELLEQAGITWRIYQNPNDNWLGLMHGCLAFEGFRSASTDSSLYQNGMTNWSLQQFAEHVRSNTLPQVSWILPPPRWSEHPVSSTPIQGAEFTAGILNALTANPDVWSQTVFFLTFDENDGLFDHVPPPAVPSYNLDGTIAGKSTLDLNGEYFFDPVGRYLDRRDTISGRVRPWGLGPRVPLYVISPWSKGGWVNSQVFDHTSIGQFLEKRFGINISAISPWHRTVSGDLISAFDFVRPNDPAFPELPNVRGSAAVVAEHSKRPMVSAPEMPGRLFQESGVRPSRALPYDLRVVANVQPDARVALTFKNAGTQGAVFHVYDKLHLDQIPRRYTVEAGRELADEWFTASDNGVYELWVYGPNGFLREFVGNAWEFYTPEVEITNDPANNALRIIARNHSDQGCTVTVRSNSYRNDGPWDLYIEPGSAAEYAWTLTDSGNWYDFSLTTDIGYLYRQRFAGRVETGQDSISDPAMAAIL